MTAPLRRSALALFVAAGCAAPAPKQTTTDTTNASAEEPVPYGANPAAGATFEHDGVTLYYETYGQGQPLLLIHGNAASIGTMAAQIAYFKKHYKVIAMDSRDQGRSGDSEGPITYEKMTDDLAALLDHLKVGPADVIGRSAGGIEALLLGIRHPDKVRKLVAMAANLNLGRDAIYPETDELVKQMLAAMPDSVKYTREGKRELKVTNLVVNGPHIDPKSLEQIKAPTLILSGDHDLIRLEHTVEIYNHLPNGELGVFPNSTHMAPNDSPDLFNSTVERFLSTPFVKKDRIGDMMASNKKLMAGLAK